MSRFSPTVRPTSGRALADALGQGVDAYLGAKRQKEEDALEAEQRSRQEALQNAQLSEQGIHLLSPGQSAPVAPVSETNQAIAHALNPNAGLPAVDAPEPRYATGNGYYIDRSEQAANATRSANAKLAEYLAKGQAQNILDPYAVGDRHAVAQSTVDRNNRPPAPVAPPRIDPLSAEGIKAQQRLAAYQASLRPTPTAGGAGATQPSESERRAAALYQVGEDAFRQLSSSTPPSRLQSLAARLGANEAVDQDRQLINQAARQFATSYLYVVSGATASPQEVENIAQQVQDQPGDKPETTARKAQARQVMMDAIRAVAGRAAPPRGTPPATGTPGNVDLRGDTAGKTITVNGKTFKVPE